MGARKQTSTRSLLLESAWRLMSERPAAEVTLAEVGRAAGVSRQTVYLHFASREGLLVAMADDHDERSGFTVRVAAAYAMAPRDGLERLVREWCAYMREIEPVATGLEAEFLSQGDGRAAWRDRMAELWSAFRIVIGRAQRAGLVGADADKDEMADVIWATCHFSTWRNLVGERGWSDERFVAHALATAEGLLRTPGAAPSAVS